MIQRWWISLPTTWREPLRSYLVSSLLGLWPTIRTALSIGVSLGIVTSFSTALHFLAVNAFLLVLGVFFDLGPYYRARQGRTAAANTVELAGGAKAVLIPAPKE
jgi:hypothetical protein